ncbi:hypothetical protein B0H34DRAFT_735177 [Crassisporium funariophilum]|nr:hypothetical protein B0H34DRAFT_735177 [Crassisporium funariophilum]
MATLETTLGALILGIFINTWLYGITCFQYLSYFNTEFNDPLWIKATVSMLFIVDSIQTSSLVYFAWHLVITNFGNVQAIMRVHWPYPFAVVVTAFMAFVTQIFLSYRILRLTKNVYIFAIAVSLSTISLVLGLTLGAKTWLLESIVEVYKIRPYLSAWLSTEVGVDVYIASILIYSLSQSRTGYERSDTVINRLIRTTIQTGALCGTCSIICLVLFLALPDTQIFGMFAIPIARLYANTLLDTLLCRQYLRGMLNHGDTTSRSIPTQNSVQLHVRKDIQTEVNFDEVVVGTGSQSDVYSSTYPQKRDSVY